MFAECPLLTSSQQSAPPGGGLLPASLNHARMFVPSERAMLVARRSDARQRAGASGLHPLDSRWLGRRAALAALLVWLCFVLVHDSSALLHTPARELAPKHDGPVGTEALPRSALIQHNLTTFRLPNGQCVQRVVALPELSCSLPSCNSTRRRNKLFVLTNQRERKWASFLRFDLHALSLRDDARLVDLELRLLGTDRCHSKTANFTHQLHLLNARQDPLSIAINRPYPRRLTAQWSNQAFSSAFRVALNLNARQLAKVTRARRLSFVLSEKLFGDAEQASPKPKPKP